jgi:hypothetical protein
MLGGDRLRSMRFTVEAAEDGGAIIEGTGWGHGVGMCQFGAEGMASSASAPDFVRILQHYYTGITVGPLLTPLEQARTVSPSRISPDTRTGERDPARSPVGLSPYPQSTEYARVSAPTAGQAQHSASRTIR